MPQYAPDPRTYELMTIVNPDVTEDEIPAVVDGVSSSISSAGGTITEVLRDSPWGRRRLAYPIRFNGRDVRDGYYTVFHFSLEPARMGEVERDLKLNTAVMRHLVTHYKLKPLTGKAAEKAAEEAEIDAEEAAAAAYAASQVAAAAAPAAETAETTAAGTDASDADQPASAEGGTMAGAGAPTAAAPDAPGDGSAAIASPAVSQAPEAAPATAESGETAGPPAETERLTPAVTAANGDDGEVTADTAPVEPTAGTATSTEDS